MTLEEFKDDSDWQNVFSFGFLHMDMQDVHWCGRAFPKDRGPVEDVAQVICSDRGENEGPDWLCVVRMSDGRYAKVFAGCCYTGWDAQGGGNAELYATLEEAVAGTTLTAEEQARLYPELKALLTLDAPWLTPDVRRTAQAIDAASALSEKAYDDLPVLGDALEDAGADAFTVAVVRSRARWALRGP